VARTRASTFPLRSRRRAPGFGFGSIRSVRRGSGSDPAGSRPYVPGDDLRRIDRHASARLSAASGRDEFVVREYHAERSLRVVVVADSAASMALFPPELPWLCKPAALAAAAELIEASARQARCPVTRLEPCGLAETVDELAQRRLKRGSFVFLVSDFLAPLDRTPLVDAVARGWDVVPVVLQDPCWEQSFPDASGVVLPFADAGGVLRPTRLSRREAKARREANETRLAGLLDAFTELQLDAVVLGSHEPEPVLGAFLDWAEQRRRAGRRVL
jgi:uncharacterized protein (DUF58 family)